MTSAPDVNEHVHSDPRICGGEPLFRGTRVTLRMILNSLAEGATDADLRDSFPSLTDDHLRAARAIRAQQE